MSDELKPCPFCGDKEIDLHEFGPNQWLAFCSPCGGQTTESGSPRDRAIAAWNRRSPTGGQEADAERWLTFLAMAVMNTPEDRATAVRKLIAEVDSAPAKDAFLRNLRETIRGMKESGK